MAKCKGSGQPQYADWLPTKNYPGAAVCIKCNLGIQFRKSPKPFIDELTDGWVIGILKTHNKPKD